MLKGIKFQQQKPNLQAEIDLLLSNTDKKFVPQSKTHKKIPNFFFRKMEKGKNRKNTRRPF